MGDTPVLPVDSLLLTAARIGTFEHDRPLTNASGFFFARDERLFLVTSRHVLIDKPTAHHPNRIEIELHTDAQDLARVRGLSVMLYEDGQSVWKQARDGGGEVDVALLEIDREALPDAALIQAFTPAHLQASDGDVGVGSPLLIVGFPLGFQDTLHHLPVVRQSVIASAFGLRFQGEGYFLTDGRTHRGLSGAPVVMRDTSAGGALPWRLLGVHSGRLDMRTRDKAEDETLGLNCAWYADILMTLSRPAPAAPAEPDPATDDT
ncbi:MAG: trypsin-like peptidase domain-containing protein [Rubrivivax sp.]|nr:trypsin-like peptidase domain-containing protein [Rubrivivax sp.]